MTFIELTTYGGMDWHDISLSTEFLKENEIYDIKHPSKVIAAHIHKTLTEMETTCGDTTTKLENIPDVNTIEKLITNGKSFNVTSPDKATLDVTWNPEKNTLESYICGYVTYEDTYNVHNIQPEDVIYIAAENFLCPTKGVPTVVRFYQKPFTNLKDAQKALDELQLHEDKFYGTGIIKELLVFDKTKIQNNEWYTTNMQVIEALEKHPEMNTDDHFEIYAKEHLANITGENTTCTPEFLTTPIEELPFK